MNFRNWLSAFILLFYSFNGFAQGQNNIWAFGKNHALDFNSGFPIYSSSLSDTWEGCATVCDKSGALLFYCDGTNLYDKTHNIMPGGSSIAGSITATQGVAIARMKGRDSLYIVFTLHPPTSTDTSDDLYYTIVNMNANFGNGDVYLGFKNIKLQSNLSEKMIVAGSCERQWLLVHDNNLPVFYAYRLDGAFSFSTVVSSNCGMLSGTFRIGYAGYTAGEMKISPDFKTLALANQEMKRSIDLYDFDVSTGVVSNHRFLDDFSAAGQGCYGIEFSSDASKLYVTNGIQGLFQYDLTISSGDIASTKYKVFSHTTDIPMGLRRGPDNKIYTVFQSPKNISRINSPDLSGASCSFAKDILSGFTSTGLCNGFGNYFYEPEGSVYSGKKTVEVCEDDFYVAIATVSGRHLWNDGDTAAFKMLPGKNATYWVKTFYDCDTRIDSFVVKKQVPRQLTTNVDISVCSYDTCVLSGRAVSDSVKWNDGATVLKKSINVSGIHWVTSFRNCEVFVDTFKVIVKPSVMHMEYEDTLVCFRTFLHLIAPDTFQTYLWSDGSVRRDTFVSDSTKVWVEARDNNKCYQYKKVYDVRFNRYDTMIRDTFICKNDTITFIGDTTDKRTLFNWSNGDDKYWTKYTKPGQKYLKITIGTCSMIDTFEVFLKSLDVQIGNDTTLCKGKVLLLAPILQDSADRYLWSTLDTSRNISTGMPGNYKLTVFKDGCEGADSIKVTSSDCGVFCVSFPNAFTPNADGHNDFFKPHLECVVTHFDMKIFNRWGKEVFSTTNPYAGWNGFGNGMRMDAGVYYYVASMKLANLTETQVYKGDILLIR